jgi:hypothetical protein
MNVYCTVHIPSRRRVSHVIDDDAGVMQRGRSRRMPHQGVPSDNSLRRLGRIIMYHAVPTELAETLIRDSTPLTSFVHCSLPGIE